MTALLLPALGGSVDVPASGPRVVPNMASRQWDGLKAWWPTLDGQSALQIQDRGLTGGFPGLLVGGPGWIPDPMLGSALDFDNTDDAIDLGSGTTVLSAGQPFTLVWWERAKASSGTFPVRFRLPIAGTGESLYVVRSEFAGFANMSFGQSGTANGDYTATNAPAVSASVGIWNQFVIVARAGPGSTTLADWSSYNLGAPLTTTQGTDLGSLGNTMARIGAPGAGGNDPANCAMADIRLYWRAFSASEVQELFAPQTRGELFRPSKWRIVVQGAAGGNVTVTPGAVALSLAAPAPTVVHAALPGAVALSLTEPAVTPSLAALPSSVTLSLSALAPTPVLRALPGAIALNLSALSPTPVLQATPGAVALALNTLTATPGIKANPNGIALLLNVLAPTIQSGSSVTVTPSTVALALTALSPSPAFQVAPGAVALTLAALTATPGVSAMPGTVALILAALAPTVTGPGGVTVTPAAVALTMQVLAATPGIQVTPAAVALILAVLNPSFGVPHGLATAVTVRIIGPSAVTERT